MTDLELIARTVWGEARGEGQVGMEAVTSVIFNRLLDRRWGKTITEVVKQPFQFSVWNRADPNRWKATNVNESNKEYRMAVAIARRAAEAKLEDRTKGANHYHARSITPRWADSRRVTARIGRHVFYKL